MLRSATITLAILAISVAARAAEMTIGDGKSQPENLTVTPEGHVITGSYASSLISVIRKGASSAATFVDLANDGGGTTLGVLADAANGLLWACQSTSGAGGRATHLRGFDLQSGAAKLRWTLPSPSNCNDFTVAPDKSLYIADTSGKIYRLPAGASSATLVLEGQPVAGIDGIAFFNGALYYNSIFSGKVYRVPLDAAGNADTPVEIVLDQPLSGPDGMRAGGDKLFVAEQRANRIVSLTFTGDSARVSVIKDGLQRPTGVQVDGDTLWYSELTPGRVTSMPLPR
jgi:sugar lactone lactonase YvrE